MASSSAPVGSVLYAADAPPALQMFDSRDAAPSLTSAMRLAQDPQTGLARNAAVDPSLMVYDESRENEQAHLRETADRLEPHLAGRRVVEIGCGPAGFVDRIAANRTSFDVIAVANPNRLPEVAAFVGDRFPCAAL